MDVIKSRQVPNLHYCYVTCFYECELTFIYMYIYIYTFFIFPVFEYRSALVKNSFQVTNSILICADSSGREV
jgi:hypothetical protein